MMRIESLLNPAQGSDGDKSNGSSVVRNDIARLNKFHDPPTTKDNHDDSFTNGFSAVEGKRVKMAKDAAIFKRRRARGKVHYAPHQSDFSPETIAEQRRFQIFPMGHIHEFCRTIPYSSDKKTFLRKTGRDAFEVFQYTFKLPDEEKEYTIMWDYNIGLVRITPFFKCCKYSKTTPSKVLNINEGLREISHSITGGALAAQGYWMPFLAAKAVAATFCYDIRYALTPIFGEGFVNECLTKTNSRFGSFKIDASIIGACAEQMASWRCEIPVSPRDLRPPYCDELTGISPYSSREYSDENLYDVDSPRQASNRELERERSWSDVSMPLTYNWNGTIRSRLCFSTGSHSRLTQQYTDTIANRLALTTAPSMNSLSSSSSSLLLQQNRSLSLSGPSNTHGINYMGSTKRNELPENNNGQVRFKFPSTSYGESRLSWPIVNPWRSSSVSLPTKLKTCTNDTNNNGKSDPSSSLSHFTPMMLTSTHTKSLISSNRESIPPPPPPTSSSSASSPSTSSTCLTPLSSSKEVISPSYAPSRSRAPPQAPSLSCSSQLLLPPSLSNFPLRTASVPENHMRIESRVNAASLQGRLDVPNSSSAAGFTGSSINLPRHPLLGLASTSPSLNCPDSSRNSSLPGLKKGNANNLSLIDLPNSRKNTAKHETTILNPLTLRKRPYRELSLDSSADFKFSTQTLSSVSSSCSSSSSSSSSSSCSSSSSTFPDLSPKSTSVFISHNSDPPISTNLTISSSSTSTGSFNSLAFTQSQCSHNDTMNATKTLGSLSHMSMGSIAGVSSPSAPSSSLQVQPLAATSTTDFNSREKNAAVMMMHLSMLNASKLPRPPSPKRSRH